MLGKACDLMMKKKALTAVGRPCIVADVNGFVGVEFPFVAELSKRQRSRWSRARESFQLLKLAQDQHGLLVPQNLAARLGCVTRQRIDQLSECGKLERIYINDHAFITEGSLVAWLKEETLRGRPRKSALAVATETAVAVGRGFYEAHQKKS